MDEIITVAWDELWRFGTVTGTPDAPELAMIRYQKVFGSDFITLIEGSILLRAAEAGHTELEFIEHLSVRTFIGFQTLTHGIDDRIVKIIQLGTIGE